VQKKLKVYADDTEKWKAVHTGTTNNRLDIQTETCETSTTATQYHCTEVQQYE